MARVFVPSASTDLDLMAAELMVEQGQRIALRAQSGARHRCEPSAARGVGGGGRRSLCDRGRGVRRNRGRRAGPLRRRHQRRRRLRLRREAARNRGWAVVRIRHQRADAPCRGGVDRAAGSPLPPEPPSSARSNECALPLRGLKDRAGRFRVVVDLVFELRACRTAVRRLAGRSVIVRLRSTAGAAARRRYDARRHAGHPARRRRAHMRRELILRRRRVKP